MGIIVFRGMRWGWLDGDFTITEQDDGSLDSQFILSTAYNVLPIWVRIAFDSLKAARKAHKTLIARWDTDGEGKKRLLMSELEHSMQVFISCGIAFDALYDQLRPYAKLPDQQVQSWRKNRTSRAKQIVEVIRRVYHLKKDSLIDFKQGVGGIIQYRDWVIRHCTTAHL